LIVYFLEDCEFDIRGDKACHTHQTT